MVENYELRLVPKRTNCSFGGVTVKISVIQLAFKGTNCSFC